MPRAVFCRSTKGSLFQLIRNSPVVWWYPGAMEPPSGSNVWRSILILIVVQATVCYSQADQQCDRSSGPDCRSPGKFETGTGDVKLSFKIKCGSEPYYGAYVQLVDYFQAVNDVIAHGHTDLEGNVELSGKYFYYSDSDLPPPKYEYKIIVYHYCGLASKRLNQCHKVGTFTSSIACTQKDQLINLKINCRVDGTQFLKENPNEVDIKPNQKLVCLDGKIK